jgi:GntR family transcriptional regulator/MocR family aminotransferase
MQLPIRIDESAPTSLQVQIAQEIRELILGGKLESGTRMPASRELAADLGVSRNTVVGAFERLMSEGLLEAREPTGTFVAQRFWADAASGPAAEPPAPAVGPLDRPVRHLQFHAESHIVVAPFGQSLPFDFWVGRPDARLFPIRLWQSLLGRMLHGVTHQLCEYGDPQGLPALREAIARHVGATRGIATDASRILITNGIQEGLNLLGRLLMAPGVQVAVENPCYSGASLVFAQHGVQLRPVAVDEDGMDPSELNDAVAVAYVTPSHQYPLGASLSLARREALLAWAQACGAYVAEDDYDSDFIYDGTPLPALKSLDHDDRVVYLGTFSKSLGAGLRIGYMILPAELCAPARHAKALLNNCQPWLEQAALAALIDEGGYAEHLRRLRRVYAARRNHLCTAIAQRLPDWQVQGSGAAMHVVIRLPAGGIDAQTVERAARAHGVGVYSIGHGNAQWFGADPQDLQRRVLLFGYASLNESEISDALLRLRDAVTS